jgi:hypothetical protein
LPCAALAQGNVASDTTLTAVDSLSIFRLLDSLMQGLDVVEETNQLAIRTGYNSNINGYSNTAGLGEYGLSAGISFYHKSGLFADVSGYYSNTFDPSYYQTMASIGYMSPPIKKISFLAEYRKSFYHFDTGQPVDGPRYVYTVRTLATFLNNYLAAIYSNAVSGSVYFEHKFINLRLDYTMLAENGFKFAHRFLPTASLHFEKRKWLKTKKILILPSVSWLYGGSPYEYYDYHRLYRTRLEALYRIRQGLPLFRLEKKTETDWATLNWSFSLPIYVSWQRTVASVSYTYALPENGGYFTVGLVRYIDLKNRRKTYGI